MAMLVITRWYDLGMGPDAGGAARALRSSPGRTVPGEHGGRRGQEALRRDLQEGRLGSGNRGSRFPLNGIMGLYWDIYIYTLHLFIYKYIYMWITIQLFESILLGKPVRVPPNDMRRRGESGEAGGMFQFHAKNGKPHRSPEYQKYPPLS